MLNMPFEADDLKSYGSFEMETPWTKMFPGWWACSFLLAWFSEEGQMGMERDKTNMKTSFGMEIRNLSLAELPASDWEYLWGLDGLQIFRMYNPHPRCGLLNVENLRQEIEPRANVFQGKMSPHRLSECQKMNSKTLFDQSLFPVLFVVVRYTMSKLQWEK